LKIIILHAFKAVLCHVMKLFQNLWKTMLLISRHNLFMSAMNRDTSHNISARL